VVVLVIFVIGLSTVIEPIIESFGGYGCGA
jgi:hypothetical protein